MFATMIKLFKNEDGATAIEYGLIAALIAVAAVTVLGTVGTNLTATFTTVARTPAAIVATNATVADRRIQASSVVFCTTSTYVDAYQWRRRYPKRG